jgi:hypothetical protein
MSIFAAAFRLRRQEVADMAAERWWAMVVGLAGIAWASPSSAGEVRVTVHVENHARVPATDWEVIQREIEGVYRPAGITLTWAGPLFVPSSEVPRDDIRRVAVVLVNIQEPFDGSALDTADVLGRAVPSISRAWIFANRVIEITKVGSIDAKQLLARVVAHEIGHLLLNSTTHAPHGIMRAGLALSQAGFYGFSDEQASLMRDGIRRHQAIQ